MARRNTSITPLPQKVIPTTPDGEPNPLGDQEEITVVDIERDIKRAMSELGDNIGGSKVQVFRVIKGERKPFYVTTYMPDAFSMERLADDCGGGTYDIFVFAPQIDENGRPRDLLKIVARSRQTIDGPPKTIKRPDPEPAPAPVPANAPASDIALIAKAMQDGFTQMGAALAKVNERPSMVDTLKELVALKSLFATDQPRGSDPLDLFTKFLDMQDKMRSAFEKLPADASDNSVLLALGKDFLTMFRKATDAPAPAQLPGPLPNPDALPAPHDAAAGAVPPPASQPMAGAPTEDDPMNLILRGYVELVVSEAKANNDVEGIAQTIYDRAPDDLLAKLLNDPQWLDALAKVDPRVKLYPQWFEKLRARIREIHDADQTAA